MPIDLSNDFRKKRYPLEDMRKPGPPRKPRKPRGKVADTRKWGATENSISFNFNNLLKKIKKHIKEFDPEATSDQINEEIGKSLKGFTINEQTFEYATSPNTLGGVRWFVLCPKCGKKCLKLYLPKIKDREPKYLCKGCHKLKPSSILLGQTKKYKNITRPLKRLEQIKKKLLRRNISIKEGEELLEEYDRIEKKLMNSPEYRLWMFKKEHGRVL